MAILYRFSAKNPNDEKIYIRDFSNLMPVGVTILNAQVAVVQNEVPDEPATEITQPQPPQIIAGLNGPNTAVAATLLGGVNYKLYQVQYTVERSDGVTETETVYLPVEPS